MDSELFQAAVDGQIEVFKRKVINESLKLEQLLTLENNTVLHVNIIASEKITDTTFMKGILDMCPSLLMQTNIRGETPLLMAARHGHHYVVEFLIESAKLFEHNFDDLEMGISCVQHMMRMKNEEEDTALHEAVRLGHLMVVRILTREDPHFSYFANKAGETPLYIAAEAEYRKSVSEILNNCSSPATGGPIGRTTLHAAVIAGNIELTEMLLDKVDHLTKEADDDACIPLHYAVAGKSFDAKSALLRQNRVKIVKMLLEKDKSSACIKNKKGMTALHIAASLHERYGIDMIKQILLRSPYSYEVVDNEGKNVLHYAVKSKYLPTVAFLLKQTSLTNYLLNRKDNVGNTPLLHISATSWNYSYSLLKALLSDPRVNKRSFDKQNNNIQDEYLNNDYRVLGVEKLFHEYSIKGFLRKSILEDDGQNDNMKRKKENFRTLGEKYKESSLIAATLIATVTFTAGFTLPGGYISDQAGQPQQGSAVLRKNAAFQAFMIIDTIAMVLSTTSVFLNLLLNLPYFQSRDDKRYTYYATCMLLTMWAMGLMMIAFVTGTYAVLSLSIPLAVATCFIGLSYFIILFFTIKRAAKDY